MKKQPAPLIIEQHPKDYKGFPFITLVQYHKTSLLCIVDNMDANAIRVFVLDMCGPSNVNEEMVVVAAQDWFENSAKDYPVSVHFAKMGLTSETSKIYRTINIEYVARAIGPVHTYPMNAAKSVKRRRRKPISAAILVHTANTIS